MFAEGKISAQPVRLRFNSGDPKPTCACCSTLVDKPKSVGIVLKTRKQLLFSYLDTEHFIFECKSGFAIIYCNKECRDAHNHRFNKKGSSK